MTLSEEQLAVVKQYHTYGGVENLAGLLHYLAHEFVDKEVKVPPVAERPLAGYFHLGGRLFETLGAYEMYLRMHTPRLARRCAPRGAVRAVAAAVQRDGAPAGRVRDPGLGESWAFACIRSSAARAVERLLEAAKPDLAIVFPIGRVTRGNTAAELFSRLKCPCVSALALLASPEEWMADPRGMTGTWMDLQITLPELDGVIEPIAVAARVPNEQNIRVRTPIPDRIEKRLALVLNWLKLRRTRERPETGGDRLLQGARPVDADCRRLGRGAFVVQHAQADGGGRLRPGRQAAQNPRGPLRLDPSQGQDARPVGDGLLREVPGARGAGVRAGRPIRGVVPAGALRKAAEGDAGPLGADSGKADGGPARRAAVPGHQPHPAGQRGNHAAADGWRRQGRNRDDSRDRAGATPFLSRRVPLGPLRLQGRRHRAFRHPRVAGVY